MNLAYPPPQRWQDFEELTVEVFRSVFGDPGAQGHGRSGQAQSGVDVYGREQGSGRLIGVQCKQKQQSTELPSPTVTDEQVKEEIGKAEAFDPPLDYFIIATTGSRDTGLQADIRYLQQERIRDDSFPVSIWFWEDYIGFINNDFNLSKWYESHLQGLYGEQLADKQILNVMGTAFSRAAFRTPLYLESPGEFRQALLDTERAVNTGLLLDRETRMPICRAPAGLTSVTNDPDGCIPKICDSVQSVRRELDAGIADGRIRICGFSIEIRDSDLRESIDGHRANAISELNKLLELHGESVVESPLLNGG